MNNISLDTGKEQRRYDSFIHNQAQNKLISLFPEMDVNCLLNSFLLVRTSHNLYTQSFSLLNQIGLSPGKLRILTSLLLHEKALLPSEIAKSFGITRSTVTGLIDGLEKDRLVHRNTCKDRRMTAIELTEVGQVLMMNFLPVYSELMNDFMHSLTLEEQKTLKMLLYKMCK